MQDDRVEIGDAAGEFGTKAKSIVEFFEAFVECGSPFEVKIGAGALPVVFHNGAQRIAASVEELDEARDFYVIFLLAAAGKTGPETHFHFRIDAPGKRRVAANLDLAAPDLEKIERLLCESVGRFTAGKRSVVRACCRSASVVDGNAASNVATRVRVAQADFEDGRWT